MKNYKQNAKILGVDKIIKNRLEYIRGEIEAERISYDEIAELQDLAEHIDPSDTLLLEWAGISESELFENVVKHYISKKLKEN